MPFAGAAAGGLRPTDNSGNKWQVSSLGGSVPRWRRDGKELFYVSADNTLMAATVNGQGSALEVAAVRPLFEIHPRLTFYLAFGVGSNYDVSPDGQRFLMIKDVAAPGGAAALPSVSITVVLDWADELKARVRPKQ